MISHRATPRLAAAMPRDAPCRAAAIFAMTDGHYFEADAVAAGLHIAAMAATMMLSDDSAEGALR